jgi:translation initiation factor 5B
MRQRGASLCDIAVVVVDIMHGVEQQTKESIEILRKKKCPFIVALNKIDRLYGWNTNMNSPFQVSLKQQNKDVQIEFEQRVKETIAAFANENLNAELYYRNKEVRTTVSIVPISAVTGEGVPDLLLVLVQLTQRMMTEKLLYLEDQLDASVLEVKVTEGLGPCIDVILVNGVLRDTDTIVLCGMKGAIVTNIRALLTPQPMKELRLKTPYMRNKMVKAAMGLKIAANKLEDAVPGSQLVVVRPGDDVEMIKREVQRDLEALLSRIDKQGVGVSVQASTLGSLEALISFLHENKVPISALSIGPIFKKDIIRAGVMLEKPKTRKYALILAFDVHIHKDAEDLAKELDVKIFRADIIYHLFEEFKRYMERLDEEARLEAERAGECVWPCVLEILPQHVFMKRNPILVGCKVKQGVLKLGTPICVPSRDFINLGRVVSIEQNNRSQESAKVGDEVAVKIMPSTNDQVYAYDRHFNFKDELFSKITRESLYTLKTQFGPKLTTEEINLLGWMKHEIFKF